jgi:hypothetical protein
LLLFSVNSQVLFFFVDWRLSACFFVFLLNTISMVCIIDICFVFSTVVQVIIFHSEEIPYSSSEDFNERKRHDENLIVNIQRFDYLGRYGQCPSRSHEEIKNHYENIKPSCSGHHYFFSDYVAGVGICKHSPVESDIHQPGPASCSSCEENPISYHTIVCSVNVGCDDSI